MSEVIEWSTNPLPDGRYTLTREDVGQPVPHWVARFCGEWIYSDTDDFRTWLKIIDHNRTRRLNGDKSHH